MLKSGGQGKVFWDKCIFTLCTPKTESVHKSQNFNLFVCYTYMETWNTRFSVSMHKHASLERTKIYFNFSTPLLLVFKEHQLMPREVTKNNTKKTFCSFQRSVYHPPQKPKFSLHTLWPNANKEKNMTCLFINFLRSWCSFFIMRTFLHFHNWSVFSTLRTIQTDVEC